MTETERPNDWVYLYDNKPRIKNHIQHVMKYSCVTNMFGEKKKTWIFITIKKTQARNKLKYGNNYIRARETEVSKVKVDIFVIMYCIEFNFVLGARMSINDVTY